MATPASPVVPEEALDYAEILRRGGANCGDEDFALCKCPSCGRVSCDARFPFSGAWIRPRAPEAMQVTWADLAASPWRWVTLATR